jgi:hypothetical protein
VNELSANTPNSRRRMNSPLPAIRDIFHLTLSVMTGNGGFNRRRLIPRAPASTPTERRGYNFLSPRLVATSLCRGAAVPSASASTPTERRGYNFPPPRLVATSLCRVAAVPSALASTPTERRGYNPHFELIHSASNQSCQTRTNPRITISIS